MRQLTPADQRAVPLYHIVLSNKSSGKEGEMEVDFQGYYICLPNSYILFSKWLNNCPPVENTEQIPLFGLLAQLLHSLLNSHYLDL